MKKEIKELVEREKMKNRITKNKNDTLSLQTVNRSGILPFKYLIIFSFCRDTISTYIHN